MAKETDKIRLPELPIFKKYSLAVRQEYVTPQEVLDALERTTARVERLVEKAEEDRRRREEQERGEAERIALEEQEKRWSEEGVVPDEPDKTEIEEDIPGTMELEKADEVAPVEGGEPAGEELQDERPFWEVDDDELPLPKLIEEPPAAEGEPEGRPKGKAKPKSKPKAKKAKSRPRPQVVQVSHRGKPITKKTSKKTTKSGAKRKAK